MFTNIIIVAFNNKPTSNVRLVLMKVVTLADCVCEHWPQFKICNDKVSVVITF